MNSCGPSASVPDFLRLPPLFLELLFVVYLPARIYDEQCSDHRQNAGHIYAHIRELARSAVDKSLMKFIRTRIYE